MPYGKRAIPYMKNKRELFAIDQMGLENVTRMNDYTELFNDLFQNGGLLENE